MSGSSVLTTHVKIKKGADIDIDHRVTKQQYTTLLPLNGIKGGRKTSCMACQQNKTIVHEERYWIAKQHLVFKEKRY